MFTFGRDHEKKCAVNYLRDTDESRRITDVVDAVHDVIEGKITSDSIRPILIGAFSDGGSGVWEQCGSWIIKLAAEHPGLHLLWHELSKSPDHKVRFRVACFIDKLPRSLALELGEQLKDDRHKKTREMARSRLDEFGT